MPALNATNANLIVNSCVGRIQPGTGLPGSVPPAWNNQRQLTGLWHDVASAGIDPLAWPISTPPLRSVGDLVFAQAAAPSWWTVNLYGLETDRILEEGQFLPGLSRNDIINFAENGNSGTNDGPGAVFNPSTGFVNPIGQGRVTRMKARVTFETLEQERQIFVDIGTGIRLSVLASAVRVELLVPQRQQFIDRGTTTDAARGVLFGPGPGLLIDTLIGASCLPCFAPRGGCCKATFTQTVILGTNRSRDTATVPIPPGAKEVTMYPLIEGALPVAWSFLEGVDFQVGNVLPIPGTGTVSTKGVFAIDPGSARADRVPIPQNATHIQPEADGPGDGVLSWNFIWHLEF